MYGVFCSKRRSAILEAQGAEAAQFSAISGETATLSWLAATLRDFTVEQLRSDEYNNGGP